jgi:hypothetical protein
MKTKAKPRTRRAMQWLRETWAELDYLQRRLIELEMQAPPSGCHRSLQNANSSKGCTPCRLVSPTMEWDS